MCRFETTFWFPSRFPAVGLLFALLCPLVGDIFCVQHLSKTQCRELCLKLTSGNIGAHKKITGEFTCPTDNFNTSSRAKPPLLTESRTQHLCLPPAHFCFMILSQIHHISLLQLAVGHPAAPQTCWQIWQWCIQGHDDLGVRDCVHRRREAWRNNKFCGFLPAGKCKLLWDLIHMDECGAKQSKMTPGPALSYMRANMISLISAKSCTRR